MNHPDSMWGDLDQFDSDTVVKDKAREVIDFLYSKDETGHEIIRASNAVTAMTMAIAMIDHGFNPDVTEKSMKNLINAFAYTIRECLAHLDRKAKEQ
jgi:phytoene dehydrogenase-like protein